METNPLRRLRLRLGFKKQGDLAAGLGVSQQALSSAERKATPPLFYRDKLLKAFPERKSLIEEMLKDLPISREDVSQASQEEDETVPKAPDMEDEALPWVVTFRTRFLLDRVASLARSAALQPQRVPYLPYGLLLSAGEGGDEMSSGARVDNVLFPHVGALSLKAGTVVLLGSPYRHAFVPRLMEVLLRKIKARVEFRVSKSRRFFFFGYPTTFVDLHVEGKVYHPSRWVDEDDAIYYEDYGMILHSPLAPLVEKEENPFGKDAVRILLIAGAHRLATGTGVRFVEEPNLQSFMLGEGDDFEGMGALAYRVVVRSGDFSTVEELSLIRRWKETPTTSSSGQAFRKARSKPSPSGQGRDAQGR